MYYCLNSSPGSVLRWPGSAKRKRINQSRSDTLLALKSIYSICKHERLHMTGETPFIDTVYFGKGPRTAQFVDTRFLLVPCTPAVTVPVEMQLRT